MESSPGQRAPATDFQEHLMRIKIVKTVAVGTIAGLGLAAVAFPPAASATTAGQSTVTRTVTRTATGPHLAVLTEPVVQVPVRKAA
jgi:hypothetical protein